MTSRELVLPRVLATGTASIATATTTALDFGTPNDIKVAEGTNYRPGDRLVLVLTLSTAGTTNTTSVTVQDADDSSGSIGTPATAVITGTLPSGTGTQQAVVGIRQQVGRPWIRVNAVRASGTTDTTIVTAVLLAIPHNL